MRQTRKGLGTRISCTMILLTAFSFLCATPSPPTCLAFTNDEVFSLQVSLKDKPVGQRIAAWAEKFVGTSYDKDPRGAYVSDAVIVMDEKVDCMYLTFRAVELATSTTPEEAIYRALDKRFHSKGILVNGAVMNYDDRFISGEEMIESGKWGEEITSTLGSITLIRGFKAGDGIEILQPNELIKGLTGLKSGDLIFFIKTPSKRVRGEIVGHIGIIKTEQVPADQGKHHVFLIHAQGTKAKGGEVKKVLLKDYIVRMPFAGAKITRFP